MKMLTADITLSLQVRSERAEHAENRKIVGRVKYHWEMTNLSHIGILRSRKSIHEDVFQEPIFTRLSITVGSKVRSVT
jgi:hypothetical protein